MWWCYSQFSIKNTTMHFELSFFSSLTYIFTPIELFWWFLSTFLNKCIRNKMYWYDKLARSHVCTSLVPGRAFLLCNQMMIWTKEAIELVDLWLSLQLWRKNTKMSCYCIVISWEILKERSVLESDSSTVDKVIQK